MEQLHDASLYDVPPNAMSIGVCHVDRYPSFYNKTYRFFSPLSLNLELSELVHVQGNSN
jgi:hypothetical protein